MIKFLKLEGDQGKGQKKLVLHTIDSLPYTFLTFVTLSHIFSTFSKLFNIF